MRARALLALTAALWIGAAARDGVDRWIATTDLPPLVHATGTEVRAQDGTLLRAYTVEDGRWRLAVGGDEVDPRFVDMLLAYEDKRFYSHAGVDPVALLRAGAQALWHGRIVSGGSTLTMQVARLLEGSGTGHWTGKLRQMRLALALERRLGKDEILALYLHLAPYGGNIEGVRAAALAWLGKEPRRLTPAEAALLVAMPQAPEARRPDRHPDSAQAARDRVLARLSGTRALSAEAAAAALRDPAPRGRTEFPQLAAHLADRAAATGPGPHVLTLDATLQAGLERLAASALTARDPRLSLAIVVADHTTGAILASVGSPSYSNEAGRPGFVDMARALRSPGSTLKPLVYALAFDRGIAHPETLIADTPVRFGTYAPQNFDGRFRGDVRMAEALQLSLNVPVVRLADRLGPAHVMAALRSAGLSPALPEGTPGLAIVLGGLGVTLTDMVQLYATLAQNGRVTPLVWRAADLADPTARYLVAPRAAWMVGHVLAGIAPPPAGGPPGRVAYKTGTSYGFRDAWAIGYDGRYVAGVWMGRPDGTPVPGAFGAETAAPLLFEVLNRVRSRPVPLPPPPRDTLLVSGASLPPHLQRFGGAEALIPALSITFPPDGARLEREAGAVPVKWRGGTPPFVVLADGAVVATGLQRPETEIPGAGPGFATLTVLDGQGRSGSVRVELR
ncbi:MAG: penicillin-binding protein 1C [Roseivivax sp.]|nr:penicillin-binding protein 1C [Roseivivax sp.]